MIEDKDIKVTGDFGTSVSVKGVIHVEEQFLSPFNTFKPNTIVRIIGGAEIFYENLEPIGDGKVSVIDFTARGGINNG